MYQRNVWKCPACGYMTISDKKKLKHLEDNEKDLAHRNISYDRSRYRGTLLASMLYTMSKHINPYADADKIIDFGEDGRRSINKLKKIKN